jgi:hypothetical protein
MLPARILLFLAAVPLCFAQTATINGIVTDTSDAIIVGARLDVQNLARPSAPS